MSLVRRSLTTGCFGQDFVGDLDSDKLLARGDEIRDRRERASAAGLGDESEGCAPARPGRSDGCASGHE